MFISCNKYYFCIVDNYIKFPVIKKMEDLLADSLILACKIISSEHSLPQKIMSDAGSNFISDILQKNMSKHECRTSSIIIKSSPEQWTGGSGHQIHKASYQKMH